MTGLVVGDFGPLYRETVTGRFPVEPYNAASNLIFLLICIIFCARTRGSWQSYPVSVCALSILFIGFVGGSLYHATRSHNLWLFLDFIPIAVLVALACIYFWYRITAPLATAVALAFVPIIALRWLLALLNLPRGIAISASYAIMAIGILLPAGLLCWRKQGQDCFLLVLALLSFVVALGCRIGDADPTFMSWLPMGTHFLWHLFGGLSTALLLEFLFRDERARIVRSGVIV